MPMLNVHQARHADAIGPASFHQSHRFASTLYPKEWMSKANFICQPILMAISGSKPISDFFGWRNILRKTEFFFL